MAPCALAPVQVVAGSLIFLNGSMNPRDVRRKLAPNVASDLGFRGEILMLASPSVSLPRFTDQTNGGPVSIETNLISRDLPRIGMATAHDALRRAPFFRYCCAILADSAF